ncbi:Putative white-brown complex homolog protein 30 [Seminavis robusta]|uniref:White-brown complex homolog protein 30 n=1 Tax=Seminavis robusta TaxID=568900 RepID=A0A9N8E5I7_9STRA|nr:Putative white-brown complex homolog protein 30 [Seminavis robusta]|eukprot:Sro538_g162620.1 Putative white-brown complex homolog protein 30 (747) ;mRNA; f:36354-39128
MTNKLRLVKRVYGRYFPVGEEQHNNSSSSTQMKNYEESSKKRTRADDSITTTSNMIIMDNDIISLEEPCSCLPVTVLSEDNNGDMVETKLQKQISDSGVMIVESNNSSGTQSDSLSAEDIWFEEGETARDLENGNSTVMEKVQELGDTALEENPFAPRPGKTLLWTNVNMTMSSYGGGGERKILDNVWGEVPRKEITAIMGPSGAGKTSLLNVLAGRAAPRGPLKITADVRLDNYAVNPRSMKIRKLIAFVAQDDSLQATATPRESIAFSARLRLPRSTTDRNIQKLTDRMLAELGLAKCADTVIGGMMVKGLSGGERKRTSVGVELVTKPDLVCLDEPTSGLDSFSAVQLCQVLKKVTQAGSGVLMSIHQPASDIFCSFGHLIILNEGRVMYQGSVANVPTFFAQRGHPCPPHFNPADWIMNRAKMISTTELCKAGFYPEDERILKDPKELNAAGTRSLFGKRRVIAWSSKTASKATQIRLLFRREVINLTRDKIAMAGRLGFSTLLSLMMGAIFWDVGNSDSANIAGLQGHFGGLVLSLVLSMIGTAQPSLLAFPLERPVFVREYSTNHYSVLAYFTSRFLVEATVTAVQVLKISAMTYYMMGFNLSFGTYCLTSYALAMSSTALAVAFGCAIEDPKLGMEMFPLLFIPQLLFSGFFVIPSMIPSWIRWQRYIFPLTYGLQIAMLEEFDDCGSPAGRANCRLLIESIEADADQVCLYWILLVVLFIVFRVLALAMLRKKATKFF